MGSSSNPAGSSGSPPIVQVNDSVYELNRPLGRARIQVLFFHGLQLGDPSRAHLSTWESEDGSCYWPQTWLVEELRGAHVFSVSCSGGLGQSSIDLYNLGENLVSDLLQANIGQVSYCPVVLVGHSFGGLIIKELCCQAHNGILTSRAFERTRRENFLSNLRGIFYYATPHRGSPVANKTLEDLVGDRLMKYFEMLSTETSRLNDKFDHICTVYEWEFAGLGEGLKTKLGKREVMVAPEQSARVQNFNVVQDADHFSICRPRDKTSRTFWKLRNFLATIAKKSNLWATSVGLAIQEQNPDNFQRLPKKTTGVNSQLEYIRSKLSQQQRINSKLKNITSLGLAGIGGQGKTTLAMALFNELCLDFEYTCFVPRVKETIDSMERQVWNNMHYKGKKVGDDEKDWCKLKGRQLLLVLDDISAECDIISLLDRAKGNISESSLIVTSRERDLLERLLDDVHEVQLLDKINARHLFKSHAFPNQAIPPSELANLMETIVEKCEGLPLTLEVLGQCLKENENVADWMQTLRHLMYAEALAGRTDNQRLWEKLRPSYDGLKEIEQKIFLDATTLFGEKYSRWTLRDAKAAWSKTYDTHDDDEWQSLVKRCLVYDIQDNETIQVHEQLQSMGRKIATGSNIDYQSRVSALKVALKSTSDTLTVPMRRRHRLPSEGNADTPLEEPPSLLHPTVATPSKEPRPPPLGHEVHEQLPGLRYIINDIPVWPEAVILGFQHYIVNLGTIVMFTNTIVPLMGGDSVSPQILLRIVIFFCLLIIVSIGVSHEYKLRYRSIYEEQALVLQTILFLSGLNTFIQTTVGSRLPVVMGVSFAYLVPILSIINNESLQAIPDNHFRFRHTMQAIQGALIVASTIQIVLGFSGAWGSFSRFVGPITIAPVVALTALGLYPYGFPLVAQCLELGLPSIILTLIYSQYWWHYRVEVLESRYFHVFELFPLVITFLIVWLYSRLAFVDDAGNHINVGGQRSCRTVRADAIGPAPSVRYPYPWEWGTPTFDGSNVSGIIGAVLASVVESNGGLWAAYRLAGATPPPPSVLSRGIGWGGVGILLNGVFGAPAGSTVSIGNVGLFGITRVGSRRVIQLSAIWMIFFSIYGKLGGFFASIPVPVFAGFYCILFGVVAAVGISSLQFANMNKTRNLFIIGFALYLGFSIPFYFYQYRATAGYGPAHTKGRWFNDTVNVFFSSGAVIALLVAGILDNSMRSTQVTPKDRGVHWFDRFHDWYKDSRNLEFYGLPAPLHFLSEYFYG